MALQKGVDNAPWRLAFALDWRNPHLGEVRKHEQLRLVGRIRDGDHGDPIPVVVCLDQDVGAAALGA